MPTRTISTADSLRPISGPPFSPPSISPWNKWQRRAIYLIDPFAYVSVNARAGDANGRARLEWIYGISYQQNKGMWDRLCWFSDRL